MNRNMMLVIGAILIILVAGIAQFLSARTAVSPTMPTATSTSEQITSATTTSVGTTANVNVNTTQKNTDQHPLPLANGDNIVSWNFKGAYTDNPELIEKAENEIKRLSGLLATATSSAMILSIGIANQYELLGDGKNQYEYLERAARTNPENGLPWHNLGVLMEKLGAFKTARTAYEKSTFVQPELKFYHYAYIEFLTSRTKDDVVNIEKAFAFAEKNIGNTPYLTELRTEWQKP